jgi:ribosomal protein S18 acetylase RimI-like enzyme
MTSAAALPVQQGEYSFVFSDVSKWTAEDKADIQSLYSTFFNELGLEFNPALDSDFTHPEKYFLEENRGAYIQIIFTSSSSSSSETDSSKNQRPHIVGVVGVRNYSDPKNEFLGENCCEIKRMYIQANHRGGGRGRRLLQMLMEKIYELKYSRIVLDTQARLQAANNLYENFGFVDTGNYNGNSRADRWMKKDVTAENMTMGFLMKPKVVVNEEEKFA